MTVLKSSGVTFSGRSTRNASSSKYTTVRVSTIELLKKGHWLHSNFERFYKIHYSRRQLSIGLKKRL